jgi:hypothetical protein
MRARAVARDEIRKRDGAYTDLLHRLDHDHLLQAVDAEDHPDVTPAALRRPLDQP